MLLLLLHSSRYKEFRPVPQFSSVAQSCPTPCDPMDCSPPGSSVQARMQEWVAIPFSRDLPDPGIDLGPPTYRQILYRLSHWEARSPYYERIPSI